MRWPGGRFSWLSPTSGRAAAGVWLRVSLGLGVGVGLVAAAGRAHADSQDPPDVVDALREAVHVAAACPDSGGGLGTSPLRVWCLADGWDSAPAPAVPQTDTVLLGLTVEIQKGDDVGKDLLDKVGLSALAFHPSGKGDADSKPVLVRLATITPSSPDQNTAIGDAVAGLAGVFKGVATQAMVDPDLYDYLQTLPASATYPAESTAHGFLWTGKSTTEVRKVGSFWVTVEKPLSGPQGIWLSIFTDAFHRASPTAAPSP
jgi:hypothetical protein